MKKTYQKVKLDNICLSVKRGVSPKYVKNDGIVVINQKCVRNGAISFSEARLTSHNTRISKDKFIINGDILVNSTGTGTLGRSAPFIEKKYYKQITVDSHVTIIRPDPKKINPFYLANHIELFEPILINLAKGATNQVELSPVDLKELKLFIPDREVQDKIVDILQTYNKFIENNRRRIQLLEEAARLLYREWFVYFRFPGHENVKIVDDVPEGWKKEKIFSIADINYGKNLPTNKLTEEGEYPVYGAAKIIGKFNKYTKEKRTIIAGCRGSVGQVTITRPKSYITNNSFTFEPKNTEIFYWLYFSLDLRGFSDVISGTAQPQITLSSLSKTKLLFSNIKVIKEFESKIESYFDLIFVLEEQNQKLAQARDLLLPRLMSGKIDVSEFDKDSIPLESEVKKIVN